MVTKSIFAHLRGLNETLNGVWLTPPKKLTNSLKIISFMCARVWGLHVFVIDKIMLLKTFFKGTEISKKGVTGNKPVSPSSSVVYATGVEDDHTELQKICSFVHALFFTLIVK